MSVFTHFTTCAPECAFTGSCDVISNLLDLYLKGTVTTPLRSLKYHLNVLPLKSCPKSPGLASTTGRTEHFLSCWDGLLETVNYNDIGATRQASLFSQNGAPWFAPIGFVRQSSSRQGSKKTVENIWADLYTPLIIKLQHCGASSLTLWLSRSV